MPCILIDPTILGQESKTSLEFSIVQNIDYERMFILFLSIIVGMLGREPFLDWFTQGTEAKPHYDSQSSRPPPESYEEFSRRRHKERWDSSSYSRDYGNSDEYEGTKRSSQSRQKTKPRQTLSERDVSLKALGLVDPSSRTEIKAAYRNLVKRYHPDKLMSKGVSVQALKMAQERMKQINAAYAYLYK
ncbi:DnaJ domain-containing protein [Litorimonas sp. RW-G-Af-16]|uniref:DnaJ domain-containing protein n=1 Tax=Litorimonas sp. RW-G-Af-16 TaxID=3241168 RepID=UPI00390C6A2E